MIKNKKIYTLIIVLTAMVLMIIFISINNKKTNEIVFQNNLRVREVSVRFPIPVIEAGQTPFYVAQKNGYYKDEGLKVNFNLGGKETNPVKMVSTGVDEIGVLGGPDTLIVAKSKNIPLVASAIIHKDSNFPVLISLKDSGIKKVEDLNDKKIGFFYGHISTDVLHNFLNKFNIKRKEVDTGFDYTPLITKNIDAEWAFRVTAGVNLPAKGIEINTINPAVYGIKSHGYTIFTTKDTLKNNKEVVEKFLRATFKGVKFTLDNPEKAVDILMLKSNKLNRDLELKRIKLYNEVTNNSEQFPIGYMDKKMFEETYDRLKKEGVIKNDFDIKEAFDLSILKNIYKK